jgi:hypothetical protein
LTVMAMTQANKIRTMIFSIFYLVFGL